MIDGYPVDTVTKGLVKEAYEDILHPAASEIGKALAVPFQLVNKFIRPIQRYAVEAEKNTKKLTEMTAKKLYNVPEENISAPSMQIAVPALQANSYLEDDQLRGMFANLLAASMNKETKELAHPSFVNVLNQLSPEEAIIIKCTALLSNSSPICQVVFQKKRDTFRDEFHEKYLGKSRYAPTFLIDPECSENQIFRMRREGFTVIRHYLGCLNLSIHPQKISFYIDNFIRLSLLDISYESTLPDKNRYNNFYYDDFMKEVYTYWQNELQDDTKELAHIQGVSSVTDYGYNFYSSCVK